MIDLGTLGGLSSAGLGINRHGEVVGTAQDNNQADRAFPYADGTLYDLNSLVVSGLPSTAILVQAAGINDRGQIVANAFCLGIGVGCGAGGYRLDPVATPPAPIFVPTLSNWALVAIAILLLGAGLLLCRRRIKR